MNSKSPFLLIFLLVLAFQINAQLHLGFYGGLTFSNISGPEESPMDAAGENFQSLTGFHIGLRGNYEITDWMAVGAGFGYTQKGSKYSYEGPSYYRFQNNRNQTFPFFQGTREVEMDINTDHLDIPLFIQFEPVDGVQLYGGPYASFTIAARATGATRFTPNAGSLIMVGVEYNYFSDEFGIDPEIETETTVISGDQLVYPITTDAYYDRDEIDGSLFDVLDYGLHGGLNVFITSGLYLNGEIMYGLNDMTNDNVDVSIVERSPGGDDFVYRQDMDRFITFKASIGFAF